MLYRCFAWDARAAHADPDGALWFPRRFQGDGRHDNPDRYGCVYLSEVPVSCIVEQLARFRSQRFTASLLWRRGLPLALATLELAPGTELIDLDEPAVLRRERLRPSTVATRQRAVTQAYARREFDRHETASGLRWWSIHESSWMNVTLFDRAGPHLKVRDLQTLQIGEPLLGDALQFLGLPI